MLHQVQRNHVGAGEFAGYPTQPGLTPPADFADMPRPWAEEIRISASDGQGEGPGRLLSTCDYANISSSEVGGWMREFHDINPSLENCWRAIILRGRNVASFKFALAKSLLTYSDRKSELIKLEELAEPFSQYLTDHLKLADKQVTSRSSRFFDECRRFNRGEITREKLIEKTTQMAFNNVIDAFHVVGPKDVPIRFFIDERKEKQGIRLTEDFYRLFDSPQKENLPHETEARWRLVETAWELNISRNLISVEYDPEIKILFTDSPNRRVNVTSCRNALNGYQEGKCFYCFDDITVSACGPNPADVDHFFPHTLKGSGIASPIDGVWNLVLACPTCNRGVTGKFALLPNLSCLKQLHERNEYLISSHHPLRETLLRQTGVDESYRIRFLQRNFEEAKNILIHTWSTTPKGPPPFQRIQ